jgi:hypothetical protein
MEVSRVPSNLAVRGKRWETTGLTCGPGR